MSHKKAEGTCTGQEVQNPPMVEQQVSMQQNKRLIVSCDLPNSWASCCTLGSTPIARVKGSVEAGLREKNKTNMMRIPMPTLASRCSEGSRHDTHWVRVRVRVRPVESSMFCCHVDHPPPSAAITYDLLSSRLSYDVTLLGR